MASFGKIIEPYVTREIDLSRINTDSEFRHLERAHVIGQESTTQHVRVHWQMLLFSVRNKMPKEFLGQVFRVAGAASKTAVGLVPRGNTGGSNISPFKKLPIPDDLQVIIDSGKHESRG